MRYCRPGFTSGYLRSSPFFQNCATERPVDTANTARAVDTVAIANTVGTVEAVGTLNTVDTVGTIALLGEFDRQNDVCAYWLTVFFRFIYLFILFFAIKSVRFSFVVKMVLLW